MSLRLRLLLGYGLVLAGAALLLGLALARLYVLADAGGTLVRDNVQSVLYADRMIEALERMDSGVLLMLAGETATGAAQFDRARAAFARHLADERANLTVPGEAAAADTLAAAFGRYVRAAEAPTAMARYRAAVFPAFQRARDAAAAVRDLNLASMNAEAVRARTSGRRAFWTTLAASLVALVLGAAAALAFARTLAAPIQHAARAAECIGAGDLDVRLAEDGPAELAALARTMNAMAQRLRDTRDVNVAELLSEKRKADAILRALDDGVVVVDDARRVVAFNPAAARVLGAGLRLGLPLRALAHGDRLDAVLSADASRPGDALRPGAPPLLLRAPTGPNADPYADPNAASFEVVVSRVRGPFGPSAAVVLLRDVSRVQAVERMKTGFLMGASHELRTPLTGLEMSLGMLAASEGVPARDRELVDVAAGEAARLSALVASLLDLARAEAGELRLDRAPLDARDLLVGTAARFAAQAAAQSIALAVDAPGAPLGLVGDAQRLALALSNLAANALRHARSAVRLGAFRDGEAVVLVVDDDGPGVPEADRLRVFDAFTQLGHGRPGGAGLGLSLVREIARLHGGTAGVAAAPLGGARFALRLPVGPSPP